MSIEGKGITFLSEDHMKEHASEAFRIGEKRKNDSECKRGFDVTDINSVLAFDLGYIPLQNKVILKEIPKDLIAADNEILPYDNSQEGTKYYVIAVSPSVNTVKKGDIVKIGGNNGTVTATTPYYRGVRFTEVDVYSVIGIFSDDKDLIIRRIQEYEDKLAARRKELNIS